MLLEEITPFLRIANFSRMTAQGQFNDQWLRFPDVRLFYILAGKGEILLKNGVFPLHRGSIVLIPAGTEYMWHVDAVDHYAINFDYTQHFSSCQRAFHSMLNPECAMRSRPEILEKIVFEDAVELNTPLYLRNAISLEESFRSLTTEFHLHDAYSALLLSTLLKSLLIRIVQKKKNDIFLQEDQTSLLIRQVIEFITRHFDQNISNVRIAEEFSFNPSYLNRVFCQYTGVRMHEFLLHYRLDYAMELLSDHQLSVEEIAQLSGFRSISHFSKTFKKRLGKNPTEFREKKS